MKAITVKAPWSSFLFDVDHRQDILALPRATIYRGPIVIASAPEPDWAAVAPNDRMLQKMPLGVALGVRHLVDCRPMTQDDQYLAKTFYAKNRFAWVFDERVELFGRTIPVAPQDVIFELALPAGLVVAA